MDKNNANKKIRKVIIFVFIVVFLIIVTISIKNKNKEITNKDNKIPKVNNQIATYKDISTGESYDADKINELLGFPVDSTTSGELLINQYRSSNEFRTNEIRIRNGEVDFIKEVINLDDTRTAKSIQEEYGRYDTVLYEKESDSYFDLYVYTNKGLAYLAHQDGTVLEIWYFKPTEIDTFIDKWASNYQKEPFTGQSSH